MMAEDELFARIETVRDQLLTSAFASDGWTEESTQAMFALLDKLVLSIRSQQPIPSLSIARGLDHWGVVSGELLEQFSVLGNNYNEWGKSLARYPRN